MRILTCQAENFGSYGKLSLDLQNIGLSLVYGKTGSGKSTLPDVVAWALFGTTAKDGAADDVRSWQAGSEATTATVEVHTDRPLIVTRIRGKGKNDLYFIEGADGAPQRGKDITETQKLLEQRLGVTAELFIAASYFHEFSPTGAFFTAKAKDRRDLFEKLAPLDLPKKLAERASAERKLTKERLQKEEANNSKVSGQIDSTQQALESALDSAMTWEEHQANKVKTAQKLAQAFEETRVRQLKLLEDLSSKFESKKNDQIDKIVADLESMRVHPDDYYAGQLEALELKRPGPGQPCSKCGQAKDHAEEMEAFYEKRAAIKQARAQNQLLAQQENSLIDRIDALQAHRNPYPTQIEELKGQKNPHATQVSTETVAANPFDKQAAELTRRLETLTLQHKASQDSIAALESRLGALNALYDLSGALRGELLKNAVQRIQDATNGYLETYFDAEIRVNLQLEGSDSLAVTLQKSGFDCNYKQLSKGQRGLLKLCFSLAVMHAAADRAGVHFANLFFDEALDGLDADLKVKAFTLFQALEEEHESIVLIDHAPEFQNLFNRKYLVTMIGDNSQIEAQDGH